MGDVWPLLGRGHLGQSIGAPRSHGAHRGIDIGAPEGTGVVAMRGGRVVAVLEDLSRRCGLGVVIDDDDDVRWTYCHLSRVGALARGQRVQAGDELGAVGTTGNAEGGRPHLHLQAIADKGRGAPIELAPMLEALRPSSSAVAMSRAPRHAAGLSWAMFALVAAALWAASKGR